MLTTQQIMMMYSGGGSAIPANALVYYALKQPNYVDAITEQVNKIDQVVTTRASDIIIPQTNGGSITYAANEAALDIGYGMQVHPSGFGGSTADTRSQISNFTESGLWIDSPSDNGWANPCVLGDLTNSVFTRGVRSDVITDTPFITFVGGSVGGKYNNADASALVIGARIIVGDYNIPVIGYQNENTWVAGLNDLPINNLDLIDIIGNDGTSSNPFTVDFRSSGYFTGDLAADTATLRALRVSAGDNAAWLDSLPTPAILSDNPGGFKIELGLDGTSKATGIATLLKSGDTSLLYDADIGELQAKVAASTATLSLPDLSAASTVAFVYDGANIYARADGIDGVGVASTTPALDANCDILQDGAGGGYCDNPIVTSIFGGGV